MRFSALLCDGSMVLFRVNGLAVLFIGEQVLVSFCVCSSELVCDRSMVSIFFLLRLSFDAYVKS